MFTVGTVLDNNNSKAVILTNLINLQSGTLHEDPSSFKTSFCKTTPPLT